MPTPRETSGRARGEIEKLPSGSLRVKVYAGIDPVTNARHYLRETVPAGPRAEKEAQRVLTRLTHEVNERRNPRTSATVRQLLERHLDRLDVAPKTKRGYERYIARHIDPLIGKQKAGAVDADMLESLYAELQRCQDHCDRRRRIAHRTPRDHVCDPHKGTACSPPDPAVTPAAGGASRTPAHR